MALFKFGLFRRVSKPDDFVRAILTQVVSSGFVKTVNLGSQLLLLKLFGLEGYGIYVIAITAMDTIATIFNLNSGQAFQVKLSALVAVERLDDSGLLIIKTIFGFLILCGLLGSLIALGSFIFEFRKIFGLAAGWIFLGCFARGLQLFCYGTISGLKKYKELAVWQSLFSSLRFLILLLVTLNFYQISDIWGYLTLEILFLASLNIVSLALLNKGYIWTLFRPDYISGLRTFEFQFERVFIWQTVRKFWLNGNNYMRLKIIETLLAPEFAGLFGLAKRLTASAKILLPSMYVLLSYFSKTASSQVDTEHYLTKSKNFGLAAAFLSAPLLFLFGYIIASQLFPELLVLFLATLGLFAVVPFLQVYVRNYTAILLGREEQAKVLLVSVAFNVVGIFTLLVMLHSIGVVGAALEAIVVSCLNAVVLSRLARQKEVQIESK